MPLAVTRIMIMIIIIIITITDLVLNVEFGFTMTQPFNDGRVASTGR